MPYSNEQYLLDRFAIQDTTHKLWLLLDLGLPQETFVQRCVDEILAPDVHVDYTSLLGSPAKDVSSREQAQQWARFRDGLDGTLHHTGAVVPVNMPVPDGQVEVPETVAVHVKAITTLTKGDAMTQNQAVLEVTLKRLESLKGNAWRIVKMKSLNIAYTTGEPEKVFS